MNSVEEYESTYATRLTATAPAAIAVIELSGPSAETWLLQCWRPATKTPRRIDSIRYGTWSRVNQSGSATRALAKTEMPEDVIICWVTPNIVEIHCHGGKQAADRILHDLKELGAEISSSDERISKQTSDPYVVEALVDLEKSTTEVTTAILLDQVRGALSLEMATIQKAIKQENRAEAIARIHALLSRQRYGLHLSQPWRIAIIGLPNAGKSSLLNAILGYDRAIVDATAGTTRDALNEHTSLLGWPFVLVDTAGLRDATDAIEQEGIQRAIATINLSDVILLLVEPRQGWSRWHDQIFAANESKCIAIHSKADLGLALPAIPDSLTCVSISAIQKTGMDALYEAIIANLIPDPPQPGQAVPFRTKHVELLKSWLGKGDVA